MPTLSKITNNFFVSLINRLGVRPPPPDSFVLSNVVTPVSIVDTDVALTSVSTSQLLDTANSVGEQLVPAANTVLADTGAQTPGNYLLQILISGIDAVNTPVIALQRRNAANAANIWEHSFYAPSGAAVAQVKVILNIRVTLLLNERVRVINLNVGGAASRYYSNIFLLAS